jgi:hypothetical protein
MESPGLNSSQGEDPLESLLHRSRPAELPDHHFTARVMASLPPRREKPSWRRLLVLAGGAGAGIVAAVITAKGGGRSVTPALSQWQEVAMAALSNPWMLGTGLLAAAAAAYAWWRDEIDDLLAEVLG